MNKEQLLSPFVLGGMSLKNRVVLAPMTRARAGKERVPNKLMAEYYVQRANAGLLIAEATSISEQGLGWVDSLGIYSDAHVSGWAGNRCCTCTRRSNLSTTLALWPCFTQ